MEEETRNVYVTVRLKVKADCNIPELIENVDYEFVHGEDIVDTEIIKIGYRIDVR